MQDSNKYDCGILNFWFGSNYGAMLTCYALQEVLKDMNKNPRIINYIPSNYSYDFFNSKSADFSKKYLNLTQLCRTKSDLEKLNEQTDTFIAGSDQIWRYPYFWDIGANIFQLNFANSSKKKIAYAASFGTDCFEGNYTDTIQTKFYLQQFDNISVREDDGVDICRNTFGVDASHVLDPVFLADIKSWDKIINNSLCKTNNFIASYVLDKSTTSTNILNTAKGCFADIPCTDMSDGSRGENTSVEDWLYNVKNCNFFITDSFHGVCFAIIFNKPFICIANKSRGYSRFKSLFKTFDLKDRCIETDNIDVEKIVSKAINWNKINQMIRKEVKSSEQWLIDALKQPVKEKSPFFEVLEVIIAKQELLKRQIELPKLQKKYIKYRILSKICIGKMRKKYKQKRIALKQEIKNIKN